VELGKSDHSAGFSVKLDKNENLSQSTSSDLVGLFTELSPVTPYMLGPTGSTRGP